MFISQYKIFKNWTFKNGAVRGFIYGILDSLKIMDALMSLKEKLIKEKGVPKSEKDFANVFVDTEVNMLGKKNLKRSFNNHMLRNNINKRRGKRYCESD